MKRKAIVQWARETFGRMGIDSTDVTYMDVWVLFNNEWHRDPESSTSQWVRSAYRRDYEAVREALCNG